MAIDARNDLPLTVPVTLEADTQLENDGIYTVMPKAIPRYRACRSAMILGA
jgi:hypothetical protein